MYVIDLFLTCNISFVGIVVDDHGAHGPNVQMFAGRGVCMYMCLYVKKGENAKNRKEGLFQTGEFRS